MLLRAYRDGTGPAATADGWFATGDAGELDADGRLIVHGRRGDLIITGGENVWPAAGRARCCRRHPGVAEVAVVGPARPRVGPAGRRRRRARRSAPRRRRSTSCATRAGRAAGVCAPRRLELVDALPRTLLGKVRRRGLERR